MGEPVVVVWAAAVAAGVGIAALLRPLIQVITKNLHIKKRDKKRHKYQISVTSIDGIAKTVDFEAEATVSSAKLKKIIALLGEADDGTKKSPSEE